jgi:hypothetical protein
MLPIPDQLPPPFGRLRHRRRAVVLLAMLGLAATGSLPGRPPTALARTQPPAAPSQSRTSVETSSIRVDAAGRVLAVWPAPTQ